MLRIGTTVALALVATQSSGDVRGDGDAAVARELALRSIAAEFTDEAAEALPRGGAVPTDVVARAIARVVPDDGTWRSTHALLDAAARAGLLLEGGVATPDPDARPEVHAAQVRVAAASEVLDRVLVTALASPYHAVRDAALDRLARALIEGRPSADDLTGVWAAAGTLDRETASEFADLLARSGALGPQATAALQARRRATNGTAHQAVSALFDAWVERPIDGAAIADLRAEVAGDAGGTDPLVEALALVATVRDAASLDPPVDVDAVVRAFVGPPSPGGASPDGTDDAASDLDLDERLERVARQARSVGLGQRLLARVAEGDLTAEAAARCVRGAAWSLPLAELLGGTVDLETELAAEVWEIASRRGDLLPPDAAALWLARPDPSLYDDVAREIGRRFSTGGELALAPVVEGLLQSDDVEVRSLAFTWLCDAPRPEDHGRALRDAFDREGEARVPLTARQRRWLARLPRARRMTAFRDVVVRLVGSAATRDPATVELLGSYGRDAEVEALVRRALEEDVTGVVGAGEYLSRLPADGRAAALCRALDRLTGELAVPAIEDALRRTMVPLHGPAARDDARPQTPKTAAGLLAKSPEGRAVLPAFLADEVPRRVRFEAALQLAKTASSDPALARAVGGRLAADLGGVDGTLRMRALEAFGRLAGTRDPVVRARLTSLARGEGGDHAERLAAIAALGRRGSAAELRSVLDRAFGPPPLDLADLEAAGAAARALGSEAFDRDLDAARALLQRLADLEVRLAEPAGEEIEREARIELRGAVLAALLGGVGRRAALPAARPTGSVPRLETGELGRISAALLRRPLRSGAADQRARFEGEDLGDVRFRWSAELTALEAHPAAALEFVRRGLGPSADRSIDGRLLLVVGDLAARRGVRGGVALRLLRTGLFAVEGEPRSRSAARDAALGRVALVRAHLADTAHGEPDPQGRWGGAWSGAALETTRLLVDVRRGRVRPQLLESVFGVDDPSVPRSGEARLAALARVLRGRAEFETSIGSERAAALRDGARAWARLDDEARDAFDDLDALVEPRPR